MHIVEDWKLVYFRQKSVLSDDRRKGHHSSGVFFISTSDIILIITEIIHEGVVCLSSYVISMVDNNRIIFVLVTLKNLKIRTKKLVRILS